MTTTSQRGYHSLGLLFALAALVALTSTASNATAAQPPRCQTGKLTAAVAEIRALLRCSQVGAGPECTANAAKRRRVAFRHEESSGGCVTVGDFDAIGGQIALLLQALTGKLYDSGSGPSSCTDSEVATLGQTAGKLATINTRNARYPDPTRLQKDLIAVRATFIAGFDRAIAKGNCNGSLDSGYAWQLDSGGIGAIAALLFDALAPCPCWTRASLDSAFPEGFFDAYDRGGASCSYENVLISLTATDMCTFDSGPPDDLAVHLPRGGAGLVAYALCIMFPDLDPHNTGTCDVSSYPSYPNRGPSPVNTNPAQAAACVAEMQASKAYQRACL